MIGKPERLKGRGLLHPFETDSIKSVAYMVDFSKKQLWKPNGASEDQSTQSLHNSLSLKLVSR